MNNHESDCHCQKDRTKNDSNKCGIVFEEFFHYVFSLSFSCLCFLCDYIISKLYYFVNSFYKNFLFFCYLLLYCLFVCCLFFLCSFFVLLFFYCLFFCCLLSFYYVLCCFVLLLVCCIIVYYSYSIIYYIKYINKKRVFSNSFFIFLVKHFWLYCYSSPSLDILYFIIY